MLQPAAVLATRLQTERAELVDNVATVFASPGVPGARPWNASEASVLTVADIRSGLIGDSYSAVARNDASTAVPMIRLSIHFNSFLHQIRQPNFYLRRLPNRIINYLAEHLRNVNES